MKGLALVPWFVPATVLAVQHAGGRAESGYEGITMFFVVVTLGAVGLAAWVSGLWLSRHASTEDELTWVDALIPWIPTVGFSLMVIREMVW